MSCCNGKPPFSLSFVVSFFIIIKFKEIEIHEDYYYHLVKL